MLPTFAFHARDHLPFSPAKLLVTAEGLPTVASVASRKSIVSLRVFKRPFCDDFLKFCFEKFEIRVWSSRRKYNVDSVHDFLMGDGTHKLLFFWDQSHCTCTGFRAPKNVHKPLVLKEPKKLWNKEVADLPWEMGDYSPSNILLVDDSPYKALLAYSYFPLSTPI